MYSSIAFIALAHLTVAAPSPRPAPNWVHNYWEAQKQGQEQKKPLAVFVGSGKTGFHQLSRDGKLPEAVQKILSQKYVCVYLDTTGDGSAKKLAKDLEISQRTGLVISDRTGKIQAFYHDGVLGGKELETCLVRYSDPNFVVRGTETNTIQQTSFYQSGQTFSTPMGRSC